MSNAASSRFASAFAQPVQLSDSEICLEALANEHREELISAATDGQLWELKQTEIPTPEMMQPYVQSALTARDKGEQMPFIVRRLADKRVVGCTRFYRIKPDYRNLSIGFTWYSKSVQRSDVNTRTKILLLDYAFEIAGAIAMHWHVYHANAQSQSAMRRLGARLDGVLRNDQILPDGRIRHTHCYSMLASEWPTNKNRLKKRIRDYI